MKKNLEKFVWQVIPVAVSSAQVPWWVVFWRIAGAFAVLFILGYLMQGGKKNSDSFKWLILVPTLLLPANIFWWVVVPLVILLIPKPFWWEQVKKVVWDPFWWLILLAVILWVPFLRVWWWVFLPWMLMVQLKVVYKWWIEWDFYIPKRKWVLLELTPPKEILMPFKAMEDIFSSIWPLMDVGNFRERWCDGELDNGPEWCGWEIASIEGKIHFYLRVGRHHQQGLEAALYGHYPDLEIREVADYVKLVPPTAPNEEWDVYGEDWKLQNPPAYPIKTYEKFFEPQGERLTKEEKRMDPMISLLEALSKLGPGENYWVQFTSVPVGDRDEPEWKVEGEKIVNKIAKRSEKKEIPIMQEIGFTLMQIFGGPKKEGEKYSWETILDEETGEKQISLTPGEREIITEINDKLKKPIWRTNIRGIYVAKRESWNSSNRVILRSYMGHFQAPNLNNFRFDTESRTRIHYFWRKRRVFLRARKMFRMAILRYPPFFPDRRKNIPLLSTEELATLFHFPLRISGMVSANMEKIESKKGGPPPNLPVEEE